MKMKKIIPSLLLGATLAGAACFSACSPIDGRQVLEDYKQCFTYVYDHQRNSGYVDIGSDYVVALDITQSSFIVECNNVRFYDGAPALSAKVSNLYQYVTNDSSYVFMLQRSTSYTFGEFSIDSLRYARVGNLWLTYFADNYRYEVNVLPRKYNMEMDTIRVYQTLATNQGWHLTYRNMGTQTRYNVELNPEDMTMSLTVNGQKFGYGDKPNEFKLSDIPMKCTTEGYTVDASHVAATDFKGRPLSKFDAYDLKGTFTTSFEGTKHLEFTFRNYGVTGDSLANVRLDFYNYNQTEID